MIPLDTAILFIAASVALALSPGPDNIFVLTQSAMSGPGAGIRVTLGLCSGLVVHTAAVALGVAAIFATSDVAFNLLKLCGGAYLVYLAWGAFRAGAADLDAGAAAVNGRRLYGRGVIMNITNPKVAIFFLAFLPQFADPELDNLTVQILLLGVLFMLSALVVFSSIALAAGHLGEFLRRSERAQVYLNRFAGIVFVGLALRLVTAER